jgi:hypothetical protein
MTTKGIAYENFAIDAGKAKLDPRTGDLHLPVKVQKHGILVYPEAGGQRRYLPKEVLEAALDSLSSVVITRLHPEEKEVNPDNVNRVRKGYVKEDVEFDGTYNKGNAVVTDKGLIDDILQRRLTEASMGYPFELDATPGKTDMGEYDAVYTWISYNHLAVVPIGRAGADVKFELDHKGEKTMSDFQRELGSFQVGDQTLLTKTTINFAADSQTAIDAMSSREEKLMAKIAEQNQEVTRLTVAHDACKEEMKKMQTAQDGMVAKGDLNKMISDLVDTRQLAERIGLDCKTEVNPHVIKQQLVEKLLPKVHESLKERDQLKDEVAVDAAYLTLKENASFYKEMHDTGLALQGRKGAAPVNFPKPGKNFSRSTFDGVL